MMKSNASHASRHLPAVIILLLTASLFSGCRAERRASKADTRPPATAEKAQPTPQQDPEANIYVDEAMLAKPYAIVGGTVENVGGERLQNLSVEIELKRREGGGTETREVSVRPDALDPGGQGKYSLKVLSDEWGSSRVVGLRADAGAREVVFKSLPGAKRPPERPGAGVVVIKSPRQKKSNGDDFINTPDTPVRVP